MLNDYYARRGRMGFGTIKPFQMNMPEIRPQEEDDTLSTIGGILQGLPGAIGAVKGKIDSTPMPHEAPKSTPIITPDRMPHEGGGRIDPTPMPYEVPKSSPIVNPTPMPFETGGRVNPVPMPFESKRIGAPPMPFEIAKRLPNFAGFLARGGKVKKNQFAIVGENGPEVVNNNNGEVSVEPVQLGQVGDLTQRGMSPMPSQATEPAFATDGSATYRKPGPEDLTQYEQPMEAMSGLENAKFDYETALKSKPGKEKWWKDALVKTAQVVSNMFNPQNQVKVQGYGAMKRDKMIQDAYGRYKPLQDAEDKRVADAYRQKQIENIDRDNTRQEADVERKRIADANKAKYYEGVLDDKRKGRELREQEIEGLKEYRKFLIENGTRNTDAKIRQIDERLKDYDLDRQSRETIARMTEAGRNARANIAEHGRAERAKAALEGMDTRQRKAAIDKAVDRWKQQNPGYSADDVKNVRDNLIKIYGQ